ncbi:UDP-N-acetyl-D-mannosamine dehydrogenase [compost metagenome]
MEPNIEALPVALENRNNVKLLSVSDAIQQADVVVILVKHKQFIGLQSTDAKSGNLLNFVNA